MDADRLTRNSAPFTPEREQDHNALVRRIIRSYHGIIRLYGTLRFGIIPLALLDIIDSRLPREGLIFDFGCGFGLFGLYMAARHPGRKVIGLDIDARRLAVARRSAQRLGITNATFVCRDVRDWTAEQPGSIGGLYCLDVLHHCPREAARGILARVHDGLSEGGVVIVKDIDAAHRIETAFAWLMDVLVSGRTRFSYRTLGQWTEILAQSGLPPRDVVGFRDWLPYPHVLVVAAKRGQG
ncbi:MAG: methyltransferase domain-containing protein [Kiritimatiellae bacterium]|nr:methyltransferase domain-containing protein [Kiritimatiellia bacterium]